MTVNFKLDRDVANGERRDSRVGGFFIDVDEKHIELFLCTEKKEPLRPFTEWTLSATEACRGASRVARVFGLETSDDWGAPFAALDDDSVEIYYIDSNRPA